MAYGQVWYTAAAALRKIPECDSDSVANAADTDYSDYINITYGDGVSVRILCLCARIQFIFYELLMQMPKLM